ncbi:MAG: hypothetical protein RL536_354, partial [Candidatus Parcubacteria bacterium]
MTVQTILRRISITSLFLIPLFALFPMNFWPFNFPNLMFFPFITGKAFYFRILVEVVFSSWVILAFLDPRYRPRLTPLTVSVSLFALIALIADLLGVNPVRSIFSNFERMEGWLAVFHLWMFYISAVHVFGIGEEGRRMWHRWLNVTVIVAVIVAFYGYLQLAGVLETHQGSRVDASLGNAAYMAVYMLMNTGIVAYLFFVARAKQIANAGFLQWLYPILTVAFGFLVVATATRGTTLGLIGGIMLACALYAVFGRGESVKLRWTSAGVIVFIILIGILFWTNRHASFIQKNEVLSRMASISLSETSNQARQFIWPMAINGAMQRPILGWGQENFNYIFNKDYNPLMWRQEQWFDRAHSVFLDWLTASGIVGLLSYLSLYVLFLITVWKSSLTKGEKSVLTGLLAGYAVHNIFVFDNLASYVFFFVILGFVGSLVRADAIPSKLGKINTWLAQKNFSKDAVEYIVAPIVLVAFVAGIYFLNVRAIQANTRLITALSACGREQTANPKLFANALSVSPIADQEVREQILSCSGNIIGGQAPGPTKQAFFELASKAIQDQITVAPKDARMYVIGGTFLNAFNQTAQALPILEKAHELTPGKQTASIQLATAYINLGRKDDAVSLLKQVYESDPSNEEAKSAYVIGLILVNKDAEAHKMFDPNPTFESERVAQVYLAIKQYDKAISILKKLVAATPT